MRKAITYAIGLAVITIAGAAPMAHAQDAPNPNSQYRLGPDSLPHDGVPKGVIKGPFTLPSNVYAGTQHTYWVYVPAQYDATVPAALMVFQDGQAFKDENGDMRAQNVMDNLIYRREIPVMIGIFINPAARQSNQSHHRRTGAMARQIALPNTILLMINTRGSSQRNCCPFCIRNTTFLKTRRCTASAGRVRARLPLSLLRGSVPITSAKC